MRARGQVRWASHATIHLHNGKGIAQKKDMRKKWHPRGTIKVQRRCHYYYTIFIQLASLITTFPEACGWCFMLSSRGFVYKSAVEAGGKGHQYHNNCRCRAVPGNENTKVGGYDPEGMYNRWLECQKTCGSYKAKDIIRECEFRGLEWLYYGEPSPIRHKSVASPGATERLVAGLLSRNGISVDFQPASEAYLDRRADALINGQEWELKTLKAAAFLLLEISLRVAFMEVTESH